ncbi:unnamed protein product, partial [Discosporangium mesarthrocarpum]
NPLYQGKWVAPLIDNPDYKGPWAPRKIPNPAFFEDVLPSDLAPMAGVAVEIWTVDGGIWMDNFVVGDDIDAALRFAGETWRPKFDLRKAEESEAKKAKKEASKSSAMASPSDGGLLGKVREYLPTKAQPSFDALVENWLPALATFIMLITATFVIRSRGRRSIPTAPPAAATPGVKAG